MFGTSTISASSSIGPSHCADGAGPSQSTPQNASCSSDCDVGKKCDPPQENVH